MATPGSTGQRWDMRAYTPKQKRRRLNPEWGSPLPPVNGCGETTYVCSRCKQEKPVTDYYRARELKRGHQPYCRTCARAATAAWMTDPKHRARRKLLHQRWLKRSAEVVRAYSREQALRTYGYTTEQYNLKLAAQGGVCSICGRAPAEVKHARGDRFAVDHDHATGQIRDLLCSNCNNGLGCFADCGERLEAALAYLQRWQASRETCG